MVWAWRKSLLLKTRPHQLAQELCRSFKHLKVFFLFLLNYKILFDLNRFERFLRRAKRVELDYSPLGDSINEKLMFQLMEINVHNRIFARFVSILLDFCASAHSYFQNRLRFSFPWFQCFLCDFISGPLGPGKSGRAERMFQLYGRSTFGRLASPRINVHEKNIIAVRVEVNNSFLGLQSRCFSFWCL